MSFIPLIIRSNNLISSESSIKYFLIQAIASTILLFTIIFYFLIYNLIFNFFFMKYSYIIILSSSLLIKIGAAPFHFWFPSVSEGLNWFNNLILITWQKLAPLISLSYLNYNFFFYFIIIFCIVIGAIGGLNQTSLRKLLVYSSINHIGWILCILNSNNFILFFYFLIYSYLSFSIIFILNSFKLFYFNQLWYNYINNNLIKNFFFINFFSLGGLPPFLGFISKWLVIQFIIIENRFFILFIMIIFSLFTLFFYLRLTFSTFLLNFNEINWNYKFKFNKFYIIFSIILTFISSFMLILINLIYVIL